MLLVAPADPTRFTPFGPRGDWSGSIADRLPRGRLEFPSVVVASNNDPWMKFEVAADWATRWGSYLINLGSAGHINVDSGYGPWPDGIELLRAIQRAHDDVPRAPTSSPTNDAAPMRVFMDPAGLDVRIGFTE
jgi:predicted alpha/beta hydrolase family esterase